MYNMFQSFLAISKPLSRARIGHGTETFTLSPTLTISPYQTAEKYSDKFLRHVYSTQLQLTHFYFVLHWEACYRDKVIHINKLISRSCNHWVGVGLHSWGVILQYRCHSSSKTDYLSFHAYHFQSIAFQPPHLAFQDSCTSNEAAIN